MEARGLIFRLAQSANEPVRQDARGKPLIGLRVLRIWKGHCNDLADRDLDRGSQRIEVAEDKLGARARVGDLCALRRIVQCCYLRGAQRRSWI